MPKRDLYCACCGGIAGRYEQWWNQDKGYGICINCVAWLRNGRETEEYIKDCYGIEGINFGLPKEQIK